MSRRTGHASGAALAAAALLSSTVLLGAAPAAPISSPAPAAVTALPDLGPQTTVTRLATGGLGIVRPLGGAPVAAVELWYRAPSIGFGAKPTPSLARVAAQVVAASKPLVGPAFGDVVRNAGGRLDITVYSDSISIAAIVPAAAAPAIVKAMTTDYYAPVITSDGFDAAQRQVAQEAFFANFDPQTVVRDAVFGQLFSSGTQHFPAEGSTSDVATVTLDAVRTFAARAFRAQNSVLVVSGAVDANVIASANPGRPDASSAGPESFANAPLAPSPQPVTRTFVEPSGGEGWVGPPISDTRAATALDFVADYLFRPDAGVVSRGLGDAHPDVFVGGQFITLNDPGVMVVVYSGKSATLRSTIDTALVAMQQPLGDDAFKAAIASFRGHLLADLQTPRQLADNFGWYAVEGAPEYAPGARGNAGQYFTTAAGLTPEFVAETVRAYLGKSPVVVSLVPQATDARSAGGAHALPGRHAPAAVPVPPAPSPTAPASAPAPGGTR